jgi:hypothetical protein
MYKKRIDGAYQDVIYGRTYMHVWVGGLVLHVGSPPSPLPLPFSVSFSTQYAISFPLNPSLYIYICTTLIFWGSSGCMRKYMGLLYCMRKYALPRCPKHCTYAYSQRPFLISLFVPAHENNDYEFQAFVGPIIIIFLKYFGA